MAESPEHRRSHSESSGEGSVRIEREIGGGSGSDSKEVESKDVSNGVLLNSGHSSPPGL